MVEEVILVAGKFIFAKFVKVSLEFTQAETCRPLERIRFTSIVTCQLSFNLLPEDQMMDSRNNERNIWI